MQILETLKASIRSLLSNKVRAILTVSGVVIGVFAIVVLISLVQGVQNYVVDQFNTLGTNLIIVSPGRAGFEDDPAMTFTNNKLELKHVDLIEKEVGEHLVGVAPNIRVGKSVYYKTNKYYGTIIGVTSNALEIVDANIDRGRFFTKSEEDSKAKVAVIGAKVEEELFKDINPIGKKVKIDKSTFTIIGTTTKKSAEFDKRLIVPYTALEDALNIKQLSGITAKAKSSEDTDFVVKQIEYALLKDLKKNDFTVLSQKDILKAATQILGILSLALSAVAAISLLVGGIGIMNIMLVSVTERTQEIGLRKALGATPSNIAIQFVMEAVIISVFGGFFGLILSFLTTLGIKSFISAQVPWWAAVLALGFSAVVGVTFGTYPAIKASRKDPIESLRYE